MYRFLMIEDDIQICEVVQDFFARESKGTIQVQTAQDGEAGLGKFYENEFDLVLLDIMLPGMNGYELLPYIKSLDIPVIFLTAMGTLDQRVHGLRAGADDYITKPFEIVELLARVETVLRRYHKTEDVLQVEDVTIDIPSRVVMQNGMQVVLTMKEFELLLLFARNRNIALYRETIYENVWESNYLGDSRTVDLHVQRLRKKLGWEDKIKSVYKVGYRLEV